MNSATWASLYPGGVELFFAADLDDVFGMVIWSRDALLRALVLRGDGGFVVAGAAFLIPFFFFSLVIFLGVVFLMGFFLGAVVFPLVGVSFCFGVRLWVMLVGEGE